MCIDPNSENKRILFVVLSVKMSLRKWNSEGGIFQVRKRMRSGFMSPIYHS